MPGDLGQRGPGTTTISEATRDWLKFENIDAFNDAYVEEIAHGMLKRSQARNMSESEVAGAADSKEYGYRQNFAKFWKARGLDVDPRASDTAWHKIRAKAARRYAELRKEAMQATAPPVPAQPAPAQRQPIEAEPIEAEPIIEEVPAAPLRSEEKPLAILDASKWFVWDSVVFTPDNYHQFVAAFVPELGRALSELPRDLATRSYHLETIKNLFMQKLFTMYCNQYTNRKPEELRDNVQSWLDDQWKRTLAIAQKFKS